MSLAVMDFEGARGMGKGMIREGTGGSWLSGCGIRVLKGSARGFWSEVEGCGVQGSSRSHLEYFGGDEKVLQGSGWGRKGCKPSRGKGWSMRTRRVSSVGPEELPHL